MLRIRDSIYPFCSNMCGIFLRDPTRVRQESEGARRELVLVAISKQMAREARRQAAKHTAAFQVAGKNVSDPHQNHQRQPAVSDAVNNQQTVKCPCCERTYRLVWSDNERHWAKNWFKLAEMAIRTDHDSRHEEPTIPLRWRLTDALIMRRKSLSRKSQIELTR
jgi:hypothetical protein